MAGLVSETLPDGAISKQWELLCYGWKLETGCSGDAEGGPLSTVNDMLGLQYLDIYLLGQQLIPQDSCLFP